MSNGCESMMPPQPKGRVLQRDNVRFSFWRDNGRPLLPEDCSAEVELTPSIQLIRAQKEIANTDTN